MCTFPLKSFLTCLIIISTIILLLHYFILCRLYFIKRVCYFHFTILYNTIFILPYCLRFMVYNCYIFIPSNIQKVVPFSYYGFSYFVSNSTWFKHTEAKAPPPKKKKNQEWAYSKIRNGLTFLELKLLSFWVLAVISVFS